MAIKQMPLNKRDIERKGVDVHVNEPEQIQLDTDHNRSHRPSKGKLSDPSMSIDEVNIPEVTDQKADFIYNYYVKDERLKPFVSSSTWSLAKIPRYVTLSWTSPKLSEFETTKEVHTSQTVTKNHTIEHNADKVVSEDNFFNSSYVNHTFSNIDAIVQGASDLENYSTLSRTGTESVFKMAAYQIQEVASKSEESDPNYQQQLGSLTETYTTLADFPKDSLGLRVYDDKGKSNDEDDLIRSITDSVSLSLKINSSVIPDVFKNSKVKLNNSNFNTLKNMHALSMKGKVSESQQIDPVYNEYDASSAAYLSQPVKLIGYIIERYLAHPDGFRHEKNFYIEDIQQTRFEDRTALYGVSYVYSIRVVAAVKLLSYNHDGTKVDVSTIFVSSRPTSVPVECYEYAPPPEPNDIKFTFDYVSRVMAIHWDMPVNPQRDVKQFQVFRRKSIKEPFELIAQYGFDLSDPGPGAEGRYKTGERVDANNINNMSADDRYLVYEQDPNLEMSYPIFMHVDEDFTVDTEFFVSSAYIYAVCAVDAHGMISNYSSQHHVVFDPYKNKLITKVICDAGAPRQYPNMTIRVDAFKDTITVKGDAARKLDVYFSPDYLKVRDDKNLQYRVVSGQVSNKNSYYVLQLINLDNQKTQLLKINIKDPQNLTGI
jgi:hypothetical protein